LLVAVETARDALASPLHWGSILIALGTVAIKRLWPHLKKRLGLQIHIPASIIAIILVTLVAQSLSLEINRIGDLPRTLSLTKDFSMVDIAPLHFAYAAIIIALLGAIESLLSARVADGMAHKEIDHDQRKHDPNQELFGQGLATIASACAGGLPATGAIARTTVNVHAGARSRLAAIIHSLFLLIVVLFLAPIVAIIPTAALAGVLLGTSLRIATPRSIREALRTTNEVRIVYLATALSVVLIDLIWGTLVGLLLHFLLSKRSKRKKTRIKIAPRLLD
jgi:SulP family sulfate permease